MGVYIDEMKKPKRCDECVFDYLQKHPYCDGDISNCPLVELEAPYGKGIDVIKSASDAGCTQNDDTDFRQMIEASGLKIGFVADSLGISRQTLWAKLNGKRAFSEKEKNIIQRLFFLGPALSRGDYMVEEVQQMLGVETSLKNDILISLDKALQEHGFQIIQKEG